MLFTASSKSKEKSIKIKLQSQETMKNAIPKKKKKKMQFLELTQDGSISINIYYTNSTCPFTNFKSLDSKVYKLGAPSYIFNLL